MEKTSHTVSPESSILTYMLPALKMILTCYGRTRFFRILHYLLRIDEEMPTPMIVWYTKRALFLGWRGTTKRAFLHLFTQMQEVHPIYVQVFTRPEEYTFNGYRTIGAAIDACKVALT